MTHVPTCAPHDHPLSVNGDAGPVIFAGMVRITVWSPLDESVPAFEIVIGSWERRLEVSCPSGDPIHGIRSITGVAEYGRSLHSTVPLYVPGVVPKFQSTQNPWSAVVEIVLLKSVPQLILVVIFPHAHAS